MRIMRKILKIVIYVLLVILFSFLTVLLFNKKFNYQVLIHDNIIEYNPHPVEKFHIGEFQVDKSNYIENNYTRYIVYRKKHEDLTDDEIITRVNIGLDHDFYTNMRPSNIEDGILILCNKYNYLPSNYAPRLVKIESKYASGGSLNGVAYEAFKKMADDAKKGGYTIRINSPYRSFASQKLIYNRYVDRDGVKKADTYSARAGSSEHQTGLAIDINNGTYWFSDFANTKEYKWMLNNCYKYGWILRYDAGKEWITGYKQEQWHYRYVGVEVATYIHQNKITFEEYYATFIEK